LDPDPALFIVFVLYVAPVLSSLALLLVLIVCSGLISGSEVAFYSISTVELEDLKQDESKSAIRLLRLKNEPRRLLATILISNNFINIAIVILSTYLVEDLLGTDRLQAMGEQLHTIGLGSMFSISQLASGINFLITVVGVTCILVLFGEIAPKIYANLNNLKFAKFMSLPLLILRVIQSMITSSSGYQSSTSKEDIDAAIELTVSADDESSDEQADILKGIVKFGDVSAKQIMRSRVDVVAFDIETLYSDVIAEIKNSGYSRIPVFTEDFDNVVGILYVKDLLGTTDKGDEFEWQELVRPTVLYIPESKKIDDVLKEFQLKRTHMAIVVDEYGGSAGIVTLEDVMEEVIGDIKDEFDEEEEVDYVKLSEGKYIFEGKSMLNDVCRIIGLDTSYFDEVKGESDSLAGLVLEMVGHIPKSEYQIVHEDVELKIVSVTNRRIEKIAVSIET